MKKVKIGVLGAYRGSSMINYCKRADNAEVVAICDKTSEALEAQHKISIDKRKINLSDPLKAFGTFTVDVKLYPEIIGKLNVLIANKE